MSERTIRFPEENTRTKILKHILGDDRTALDLAELLEINESAVRRHLGILEKKGLISSYFEKADMGRPKKYYEITEEGKDLFPKETDLILNFLIERIRKDYDVEDLNELEEELAAELSKHIPEIEHDENLEEKISKLVKGFDDLGFFCSYERYDDTFSIEYQNCVLGDVEKKNAAWFCKVHRKIMERTLGDVKIEQERSMQRGDKYCRQKIGE